MRSWRRQDEAVQMTQPCSCRLDAGTWRWPDCCCQLAPARTRQCRRHTALIMSSRCGDLEVAQLICGAGADKDEAVQAAHSLDHIVSRWAPGGGPTDLRSWRSFCLDASTWRWPDCSVVLAPTRTRQCRRHTAKRRLWGVSPHCSVVASGASPVRRFAATGPIGASPVWRFAVMNWRLVERRL